MHVCHVNFAGGFSGGERQTVNLIRQLAESGCHQTLVARPESRLLRELEGVPLLQCLTCQHFLFGHLRAEAPWDVIHCHDGRAVYWGWLEWALRKTPYIITRRVDNRLGKGWFTRHAYVSASRVVCLSSEIKCRVHQRVPSALVDIIPSSFSRLEASPDKVSAIRARFPGKVLVGQVGRLLEHKGYHVTIEAARELSSEYPEIRFLLIGEGPLEESLKASAAELSNVEFIGYREDIGDWLAALDLFVFPSLTEGLGSTILDAMQFGVPVIGARAGGIPDLIENQKNGLLVEPGNATGLAEAIAGLVKDPDQRLVFAKNARAHLEEFSPSAVSKRYESLYETVVPG